MFKLNRLVSIYSYINTNYSLHIMGQYISNWVYQQSVYIPTDSQLYKDRIDENTGFRDIENPVCLNLPCCCYKNKLHN